MAIFADAPGYRSLSLDSNEEVVISKVLEDIESVMVKALPFLMRMRMQGGCPEGIR